MSRALLLSAGWLGAVTSLWLCLLVLDIYLDLVSWHPRWDETVALILGCTLTALFGIGFLARTTRERPVRIMSLMLCVFLVGLGIYAFPSEPLSTELFGRVEASPGWYRGTRVLVMALPLAFWCCPWWRERRNHPLHPPRAFP
jgi:hypothetical protein